MRSNAFQTLLNVFMKFPGIGSRQARRFAYTMLELDDQTLSLLINAARELKSEVGQCEHCYRYYPLKLGEGKSCDICSDPNRDRSVLMVVEKDADLENIRRSDVYNGLFFVLGGLLPILEEQPQTKIRSRELLKYAEGLKAESALREIVIAVSANTEGDNTADYLREWLAPLANSGVALTELGRGLSTGSELEYSDKDTIASALKNRK